MSSLNKVMLLGHVGQDPEIRAVGDGRVANLSLATSERWKGKDGVPQERTEWHRITVWNEHLIGVIERFVTKGRQIMVIGELQNRKWQDQTGQDRITTEVVLSKFRGELVLVGSARASDGEDAEPTPRQQARSARAGIGDDLDDAIPFAWLGALIAPALALLSASGIT